MITTRHLNQVETLRAIAALAVSVFHFSSYFHWDHNITQTFSLGAQGVEVFYVISGFIIPYSLFYGRYVIGDYFRYMGKRMSRLFPPYLITILMILMLSMAWCVFGDDCANTSTMEVVANVFFLADLFDSVDWINPIFATLEVELQFYLIIGLIFPLFQKSGYLLLPVVLILLFIGIETLNFDTVFTNAPYFVAGLSLFMLKERKETITGSLGIICSLIVLYVYYLYEDMAAMLFGVIMIWILPGNMRLLKITGRISYSYYLVHGVIGGTFLYFASAEPIAIRYPIVFMIFAMLLSWIGAYALYQLIEKPSIKFSKKIKYKSANSST